VLPSETLEPNALWSSSLVPPAKIPLVARTFSLVLNAFIVSAVIGSNSSELISVRAGMEPFFLLKATCPALEANVERSELRFDLRCHEEEEKRPR